MIEVGNNKEINQIYWNTSNHKPNIQTIKHKKYCSTANIKLASIYGGI